MYLLTVFLLFLFIILLLSSMSVFGEIQILKIVPKIIDYINQI